MKHIFKHCALLFTFSALALTGCSVATGSNAVIKNDSTTHLNISQAKLIANATDNLKYINPNLLSKVDDLANDDRVSILVSMENNSLADDYFSYSRGYDSISDYASSSYGEKQRNRYIENQNKLIDDLTSRGLIDDVKYNYTTLFNGFSATTSYANYKKIKNNGYSVSLGEVYALPQSTETTKYNAVTNDVDVYDTGIFNSSGVEYDGENTAVAILDSGFDVHHTVFQTMPQQPMISRDHISEVLASTKASGFTSGLKTEDVYVNTKIPYTYDYADKDPDVTPYDSEHGTHVAGIIAGSDSVITGVAINTQLVLLKVFADLDSGGKTEDILAALEDAVVIGVDAINMSLGSSCGFSKLSDNDYLNSVYDKVEEAGISLLVAASNDYSSAFGGENSNTNKTTNPDSATVGSPSTYNAALSVASISGAKSKYVRAKEDGYTFFFNEANNTSYKPYDFFEMLNLADGDNEIEYVTIPGYGSRLNYSSVDVKGKIVLVKRGDISFEEKTKQAYLAGARGIIIYNNISGEITMSAGNDAKIPLCSISKDDGEHLAKKKSGILVLNKTNLAGPFMSDFSSWGPNPDLTLKPEITAHGGNIKSSVPGGGYEELSGTSMATPNMCGIVVLIRQYLKEKYPNATTKEISKLTNQIMMSSATIALNQEGNPYSPRKQGAGLASLKNTINTKAYLSVDGSDRTKVELGDDAKKTGKYVIKFRLNNISNESLSYIIDDATMTESVSTSDSRYVAEKAHMLNPNASVKITGDATLDGNKITISPNSNALIEYTIVLSDAEKLYINKNFANGMYVEGFVKLKAVNKNEVDLSIPFLAFFGDWTKAPLFDKTFYEVESEAHDKSIDDDDKIKADYYATTPLGSYYYNYIIPLGSYVYSIDETKYDAIPATTEHAAMGYDVSSIHGITTVYAGLLRNAKKLVTTIYNTNTGEIVYENIKYDQFKAHYSGGQLPAYDMLDINMQDLGLTNNTNYTFKMQAYLDYGDGGVSTNLNNTFEFSFYVDYETPILTDAQYYAKYDKSLKKDRYYVDLYVYDNHYAMSVRPFTMVNGSLTPLCDYPIPVYGEKGTINKVTMEITDYMDLLKYSSDNSGGAGLTNGLGIMIDDYAMNSNYYYVTFPGTNSSNLEFKNTNGEKITSYDTMIGQEVNLAKLLTSDDETFNLSDPYQAEYFAKLSWTSSDETIARVKNGKAEGINSGSALITATAIGSDGAYHKASIILNVKEDTTNVNLLSANQSFSNNVAFEDIKFTYYDTIKAFIDGPEYSKIGSAGDRNFLSNGAISFYPSEQVKLGYEIKPWNLDSSRYSLKWESTNPLVATVDQNGLVTAVKEGKSIITLRITVDGKESNIIARTTVTVNNEFIISGTTLTGYKGNGGDVVIPDDKGILYIGAYAFSLYTTDTSIKVDENDWDANKTAGGNDTVTSVTIPANVQEVYKYAFYNCSKLKSVNFLSDDKGNTCKQIKEFAFASNTSLTDINLENIQVIGKSAFANCTALTDVDLSHIYALGEQAFKGCTGISSVNLTTLRNAWKEVFMDCSNLTTFISGNYTKLSEGMFKNSGLTSVDIYSDRIPTAAFENCKNLIKVDVMRDIVYVGEGAFKGCSKMNSFVFRGKSDFIYSNAFENCTALTNLTMPNGETKIEQYAFLNCTKLNKITFVKDSRIIGNESTIFEGCSSLKIFNVEASNEFYKANGPLLLTSDEKVIILAAPGYDYGRYTIPDSILEVKEGAFGGISTLKTLNLNNVTHIGEYAFAECTALTSVTFANEKFTIDAGAFAACTKLATLVNIKNTKKIGKYAFTSTALNSIDLGENVNIGEGAFAKITSLRYAHLYGNTTIGYGAFINDTGLTTVDIDADAKITASDYAFYNCTKLASIDLSKFYDHIGKMAFYATIIKVANLTNVTSIGDFAFADCTEITTLNMPIMETIGDGAFAAYSESSVSGIAITSLELPTTLRSIGEAAFYTCLNLKTITIPANVELKGFIFAYNTSLQSVTLDSSIKTIPNNMFYKASALVNINLENVERIEDGAFYTCTKLKNVNLSNLLYVGEDAFAGCTSITSLDMPRIKEIADYAFLSASSVSTINMPVVEKIGIQALSLLNVGSIVLPNTIKEISMSAFYNNTKQSSFLYDDNGNIVDTYNINDYCLISNGVLYVRNANGLLEMSSYPTGKIEQSYTVLDNTYRIEMYAAAANPYLSSVILPDTLESIGNMAFYDCSKLNSVEFRSLVAPTLEGSLAGSSTDYSYTEDSEIYKLMNKFFVFNGYYPYYYGQFKGMVGTKEKINIVLPNVKSGSISGYDNLIYTLFFDVKNATNSTYESKDTNTITFLKYINQIPANATLADEALVLKTKTAYNGMKQDLHNYGYTDSDIKLMTDKLNEAVLKINTLKANYINEKYSVLLAQIKELGTEFSVDKISLYNDIMNTINSLDKSDKSAIDITTVDEFRNNYAKYVADFNQDITDMNQASTLTTREIVMKRVAALSYGLSMISLLGLIKFYL